MRRILYAVAVAASLLFVSPVHAELKLHGLFSNHAVLQRDAPINVWGTVDNEADVTVSLGKAKATGKPSGEGDWYVSLPAMQAGGPHALVVAQGDATLERKDIYVGEVWLCSGQSNMAWKVARVNNAKQELAEANWPQIRSFNVPRRPVDEPLSDVIGSWSVCNPQTVGNFSATAYFFGRCLHEELEVPIGLINSSVGGTPIEAWTSMETHKQDKQLQPILKQKSDGPGKGVAQLYNGMIAPLAPYNVRGAIWYQGERNSKIGEPLRYRYQLPAMIANWRELWEKSPDDFPFLFVQLPNFMAPQKNPVETSGWVLVREGMLQALASSPNTGMAITTDIGEANDIHPKNKQDVGKRLARWALATTYGKDLVPSGPLYESHEAKGKTIQVTFGNVGDGLQIGDGDALTGFAIAGEDQQFVWAEAKVSGNEQVVVHSTDVPKPVAVRYAWAANPKGNLTNSTQLPASPFRTDDWEK